MKIFYRQHLDMNTCENILNIKFYDIGTMKDMEGHQTNWFSD